MQPVAGKSPECGMGENPLLLFLLMGGMAWLVGWPLAVFPLAVIAAYLLKVLFRFRYYFRWINSHPDIRSRELAKACHGAGMIAIGGLIIGLSRATGGDDAAGTAFWVVSPLFLLGLFWFCSSGFVVFRSGSAGALDNEQLVRGALKCAVGWAFLQYNPIPAFAAFPRILEAPDNEVLGIFLAVTILHFVAVWCVATGATKFLLLLLAKIRFRRHVPSPMENPHGSARVATRDESRRAGQGNKSALDNQRF
jgi:hypothetical protein